MDIEQVVRNILQEIRLAGSGDPQPVLLLVDDQPAELAAVMGELQALKNGGLPLTILAGERVRSLFDAGFGSVFCDIGPAERLELIKQSVVVAVPVLTLRTIARVSLGLGETPVENLLAEAIAMGRQPLLAIDGCIPAAAAFTAATPYAAMIVNYLRTLVAYGCRLTPARSFRQNVLAAARRNGAGAGPNHELYLDQDRITAEDIAGRQENTRMIIAARAALTAAAQRLAVCKGIEILRQVD